MEKVPGRWYAGCRKGEEILFESEYAECHEAKTELANDFSLWMDDCAHWDSDTLEAVLLSIRDFNRYENNTEGDWTVDGFTYYLYQEPDAVASLTARHHAMLQTPGHGPVAA